MCCTACPIALLLFFGQRASYDAVTVSSYLLTGVANPSLMNPENLNVVRWQQGQGFLLRPGHAPQSLGAGEVNLPENTCLALPSDMVRNLTVPVAPEEVKHLRRALPFMLEESLLEDVSELHFAHAPLQDGLQAVGVVKRAAINKWMEELPELLRAYPGSPRRCACLGPRVSGHCCSNQTLYSCVGLRPRGRESKRRYCPHCWKVSMQSKPLWWPTGRMKREPKHLSRPGFTISCSGVRGSPRRYCWQSLPRRVPTCDRESSHHNCRLSVGGVSGNRSLWL